MAKQKIQKPYLFLLRNEGQLIFQDIRRKTETMDKTYDVFYQNISNFFLTGLIVILIKYLRKDFPSATVLVTDLYKEEKKKADLLRGKRAITLDAYSQIDAIKLGVSRIFTTKGEVQLAIAARPGYISLDQQIKMLQLSNIKPLVLIDDDIFTGSTVKFICEKLLKNKCVITEIIAGIQVGEPENLAIPIQSIHRFQTHSVINIADPRDFLIGSYEGGLAVKLGNQSVRAPYMLPFINPCIRINIPAATITEFSLEIIELNRKVFKKIEKNIYRKLLLSHLWPSFYPYAHYLSL
ncbi:MAG TPA: hypothetical protein VGT05_04405 [Patescibacteria group bacterium]|nr:hypothetical protein [Patescibacteria group bacterium]